MMWNNWNFLLRNFKKDGDVMNITLNPCPHCGGEARIKTLVTNIRLGVHHRDGMICCENGDAMKLFHQDFTVDEEFNLSFVDDGLERAVDEWNERTGGTEIQRDVVLTSDGYRLVTSDGYVVCVA